MKPWSDLHSWVLPFAPGCAGLAVSAALRRAAIQFCEDTLVLQRTLAPIATVAAQASYTMVTDPAERVHKLLAVKLNGDPLPVTVPSDLDAQRGDAGSGPTAAYTLDRRSLLLFPAPGAGGGVLKVRAAVKPALTAAQAEDSLIEDHAEALAQGALALLCMESGKPYSNPGLATTAAAVFSAAIGATKARVFRSFSRAAPAVPGRYF